MSKKWNGNKPVPEKTMKFFLAWQEHDFDPDKRHEAALAAGYSLKALGRGASSAIRSIGNNDKMRAALKKRGLDFDFIADKIFKKTECKQPFTDKGNDGNTIFVDDNYNQMRALELSTKLLDVMPSTKLDINEHRQIEIHISAETVDRGQKAIDMGVIDIDSTDSEFLE